MRQRLLETADPMARLALLEGWLRARASQTQPHPLIAHALGALQYSPQTASIGSVIADCGISTRRFGKLFRQHVGVGPKRYSRLLRFRAVVNDVPNLYSVTAW